MRLLKMPTDIYEAFIRDTIRIYQLSSSGFRFRFWVIFAAQFLLAIMETSTILVISFFAMSLSSPEIVMSNVIVRSLFALSPYLSGVLHGPRSFVAFASLLTVVFILLKNLVSYVTLHLTTRLGEDLSIYICLETLERYLYKGYYWHISPASADIIHRMAQRDSLTTLLIDMLMLYSNVFCSFFLFVSLFVAEPRLTALVMGIFGFVGLVTYVGVRRRVDWAGQLVATASINEQKIMYGVTRNIREVILYHQQDSFLKIIYKALREGVPGKIFLVLANFLPSWLLEAAGFSTICGVTIWMIWGGYAMSEIIQAASMLMLTAWRVLPAVNRVFSLFVGIRGLKPQALLCLNLLETFITESPASNSEATPNFRFRKTLRFDRVSFSYPGSLEDSLSDISLTVEQGEKIGLIGPSGAGKSTLALLFSGLVSPRVGRFMVDDREMTPPEQVAYLQKIGFVSQSPILLGGTVADNVAFSRWGREYNRDEVVEACRLAAMDFVLNDPKGIDKVLSREGEGLSGGQAQRVAIARALFTRPDIIIFDEATSALDHASENIIASTIEHLPGETTVFIIAHRLTTVERCDRLIWLDNGRVRDQGPPSIILHRYEKVMAGHLK